jgi:methyl-accepting chemotaxis protein
MLFISLGAVVLEMLIFLMHKFFNLKGTAGPELGLIQYLFLLLPIILLASSFFTYRGKTDSSIVSLLVMLTLTFSSIGIIIAGDGLVEYHFSIFMVVAIMAYYEDIKLVLLMTVIFAVHHVLGFIIDPIHVFGGHNYSFAMVALHAVFLVLTSGATILQIVNKKKYTSVLEKDRENKEEIIKNIIKEVSDTSEQISSNAENLISLTVENKYSSNAIATVIDEVSEGASTQVSSTLDTSKAMNEMVDGIQNIVSLSSTISKDSSETSKRAEEGYKLLENAARQMNSIIKTSESSTEVMIKLSADSQEIGKIIEAITSIASQTNLLALNAAIEAARAGEHGKGFSVVAEEVRKLAEQSSTSASQITKLIENIRFNTDQAVNSLSTETKEVHEGKRIVDEAGSFFKHILKSTENVSSEIQELTALSEEMSAESEEINAFVDQMSEITKNFSDNFTKVSSSVESQYELIEKNEKLADNLTTLSKRLEKLLSELHI